jgi:predicted esterase
MQTRFLPTLRLTLALTITAMLASGCKGGDSSEPVSASTPQSSCASLSGRSIATTEGTATIASTQFVAAVGNEPEHCRVFGNMAPELHFEIKLPTNWNQRLLFIGGGGFDGAIPQPPGYQLQQNYVIVASNGGHNANGTDELWAYDAAKLNDYAYSSTHRTLLAARGVIQQRYGQQAVRSYFEGCSNGGREALIQAQRYPEDFDGIVARAPAWNFTWLMVAGNQGMKRFFQSAATQLSAAKLTTLSNAVLAACDLHDNRADGIVSNVAACTFDPATLRCTGGDNDSCLTDAQIATVNSIYSPHTLNINGTAVPYYIGWPAGGESASGGWDFWRADLDNGLPDFSTRFIRYFLLQNPTYNAMNFTPELNLTTIQDREALIDAKIDSNSNDNYTQFRNSGGKLILWHGTNDPAISYTSTALYYGQIVNAHGQMGADQFAEFFPAPGVLHCFGGEGSDFVDLLTPLRTWVEAGTAPSQQNLVALKLRTQPTLSLTNPRPLCKYPRYPRYIGGDANLASSYMCTMP